MRRSGDPRHRLIRASVVATLVSPVPGCSQVLGTDRYSSVGADAAVAPYVVNGWKYAAPDCGRCIEKSCAAEVRECSADPTCDPLASCIATCKPGEASCARSCQRRVRGSALSTQMADLSQCARSKCFEVCGEGSSCRTVPGGEDSCLACSCEVFGPCYDDAECRLLATCFSACYRNDACLRHCSGNVDPSSNPRFQAFVASFDPYGGTCANDCSTKETDFGCAGSVVTPSASNGDLRAYLQLDPSSLAPEDLPGILVKECSKSDPECIHPLAPPTTTNADGTVDLPLVKASALVDTIDVYFEYSSAAMGTVLVFPPLMTHSFWFVFGFPAEGSDPARGHVGVMNGDCASNLFAGVLAGVPGIRLTASTADAQTRYRYASLDNVWSDGTQTGNGQAAILNLASGPVEVTATRVDTGQVVARTQTIVRKGATTLIVLTPNTQASP